MTANVPPCRLINRSENQLYRGSCPLPLSLTLSLILSLPLSLCLRLNLPLFLPLKRSLDLPLNLLLQHQLGLPYVKPQVLLRNRSRRTVPQLNQ